MKYVNMHVRLRRALHVEVTMTTSGTTVYLGSSVIGPKDDDFGHTFLSPFWIVRVTNKKDDANMEMGKTTIEGFKHIPVFKNTKAITANTILMRYVPKKVDDTVLEPLKKKLRS